MAMSTSSLKASERLAVLGSVCGVIVCVEECVGGGAHVVVTGDKIQRQACG